MALKVLEDKKLTVVGWYHSHPNALPYPTKKDVKKLQSFQELFGSTYDEKPVVGVILSPGSGPSSFTYYHIPDTDVPFSLPHPSVEYISDESIFLRELQLLIEDFEHSE